MPLEIDGVWCCPAVVSGNDQTVIQDLPAGDNFEDYVIRLATREELIRLGTKHVAVRRTTLDYTDLRHQLLWEA